MKYSLLATNDLKARRNLYIFFTYHDIQSVERLISSTWTSWCTILTRTHTRFLYTICLYFLNFWNKRVTFAISVCLHLIHKRVLNTCKWIKKLFIMIYKHILNHHLPIFYITSYTFVLMWSCRYTRYENV